jgi:alpha-glucoside transport system substrate-binding protein
MHEISLRRKEMFSKKRILLFSFLLIFAMILAACGGGDNSNNSNEELAAQPTAATSGGEDTGGEEEMEEPQGGDAILEAALSGAYDGTIVEMFGAFVDEDARRFESSIASFEEATGIDVQYEGSGDFETLIRVRVEGGDPPDIAGHPQPGGVKGLVELGAVLDPSEFLGMDFLQAHYAQGWIDDSTLGGHVAGVWYRGNVKSLVWYPKDDIEAAG